MQAKEQVAIRRPKPSLFMESGNKVHEGDIYNIDLTWLLVHISVDVSVSIICPCDLERMQLIMVVGVRIVTNKSHFARMSDTIYVTLISSPALPQPLLA